MIFLREAPRIPRPGLHGCPLPAVWSLVWCRSTHPYGPAEAPRRRLGKPIKQSYSNLNPNHFFLPLSVVGGQSRAARIFSRVHTRGTTMSRYPTFEGPHPSYPYDRNLLAHAPIVTRADRQVWRVICFRQSQVDTERDRCIGWL